MPAKFKRKGKSSIVDDLPVIGENQELKNQQEIVDVNIDDDIIETESIQETLENNFVESVKINNTVSINSLISKIEMQKTNSGEIDELQKQQLDDEIEQDIIDAVNVDKIGVGDVDVEDVKESLNSLKDLKVLENIPDIDEKNIDKLSIESSTKNRSFIKTKITISAPIHRTELQNMLGYLKEASGGVIRHRICDLRLIGNTNKKQLADSDVKLLKNSYTIKPIGGAVNKSTRIILSVDVDDASYILIYMQKSREKFIIKYEIENEDSWQWLGDWILGFYQTLNFNLYKYRLLNNSFEDNPIYETIKNLAKTKKFIVTIPKSQEELTRFRFKPIKGENTHLNFNVFIDRKTVFMAVKQYKVVVSSDVDKKLYLELKAESKLNENVAFTLDQLNTDKFYKSVENFIKTFDNSNYDIEDIDYAKLKKRATKSALAYLYQFEDFPIQIVKVMNADESAIELAKKGFHQKDEYDAENIVFKTSFIDFAILQYSAIQTKNVDKRGYLSRPYKFRLVYSIDGNDQKPIESKEFQTLLDLSKILTKTPTINPI